MYGAADFQTWAGAARKRKRCPACSRMVEIGAASTFRRFTPIYEGWQRGGFIGTARAKFPTTHTYHRDCAHRAGLGGGGGK